MKTFSIFTSLIFFYGNLFGAGLEVKEVKRDKPIDFQSEILPMLRSNCLACHNRTRSKGDVILETPADIRKGNDDGSFVEPGNAADSFLFTISAHLEDSVMPPAKNKVGARNLKPEELGLLKLWIEQGAKGEMRAALPVVWQSYQRETPPVYAVAAGPHGRFVAAGRGNQIHLYDATVGEMVTNLTDPSLAKFGFYGKTDAAHLDVVNSLAFHPDGDLLASGGYRNLKLWRRTPPAKIQEFTAKALDDLRAVSPDGKWLATAEENNQTGLWDLVQGKRVRSLTKSQAPVKGLAFSVDSSRLLTGATDGSVRLWNVSDGKLVAEIIHEQGVGSVSILGEGGKWLASAHADKIIRIWELSTEKPGEVKLLKELQGATGDILALLPMPNDSKQLLSASKDNQIRLWNAESGSALRTINAGTTIVKIAVSPDGQRIASAGGTSQVRLWNASDGKLVADLKGNPYLAREAAREDAELAFAKAELKYFTDELKKRGDEKKKVIDRKTKAEKDLKEAEGKPIAEKKAASDKARIERDAADKKVEETEKKAEETETAFKEKEAVYKDADVKAKATASKVASPEAAERTANQNRDAKKRDFDAKKSALDTLVNAKLNPSKQKAEQAQKAFAEAENKRKEAEGKEYQVPAADKVLADAKTNKDAADKAKTAAEAEVKKVEVTLAASEKAHKDSEKKASEAKTAADKARKDRDDAAKVFADAKKLFDEANKARTEANKAKTDAAADAKKKEAALTKAEKEYLDIENPRAQFERELKRAGQDLVKAEAKEKEYEGFKVAAEEVEKRETEENKAAKEVSSKESQLPVHDIVFTSDSSGLLTVGDGKYAHLWSSSNGKQLETLQLAEGGTSCLDNGPEGTVLISKDDNLALWDVSRTWELEKVFGGDVASSPIINRVTALEFSPDGKTLASGGGDPSRSGEILIWNLSDGKLLSNLPGVHSDVVTGLDYSADGKLLASGATDKFARVTEVKSGKLVHSFEGHTHHVMGVAIQASGRILASVGADKEIKTWNVVNGDRTGKVGGFNKEITSIHYIGYGDNVLITAGDKRVKLMRAGTGNPANVRDLSGVSDVMHSGDVSRDGKTAVAGGEDGVLRVWNVADGKVLRTFEPPTKEEPDGLTAN